MTTGQTFVHEAPTRIGSRIVPAGGFPRRGAFCLVAGQLAIIVSIGRRGSMVVDEPTADGSTRKVSKDFVDISAPFAEVHLVQTDDEHHNFGHFKPAPDDFPLGEVQDERPALAAREAVVVNGVETKPAREASAARGKGREIFNVPIEKIERAPWAIVGPIIDQRNGDDPRPDVLWAQRAGYILTDEEASEIPALIEKEEAAKAQTAMLAKHPDAVQLEEDIEKERVAFIASAAARREQLVARILSTAPAAEAAKTE